MFKFMLGAFFAYFKPVRNVHYQFLVINYVRWKRIFQPK